MLHGMEEWTMAYQYDVAILGSGPGGYVAAIKAAQHGLSVALVEREFLGGTCLNVGCIPTKALVACAEELHSLKSARDFGITVEGVSFDYGKMLGRKDRVVKQLRSGVEYLMKKHRVTVYTGAGTLTGPHSIGVADAEQHEITAQHLILASGSVPSRPPIPGADGARVVNSTQLLSWPEVPGAMAVIGAGAIGMEFAYFFNALGTKVTIIEALPHILPLEDAQIAAELAASIKRQGIASCVNARVSGIGDADGKKVVTFSVPGDGEPQEQQVAVDLVLIATGRWPFTEGCGYEAQGIAVERRAVKVDEYLHTGVAQIYAIGDVIGGMLLAHKASYDAAVAVDNITGQRRAVDYRAIPTGVYCYPEVASVGMTEADAQAAGREVLVGAFPLRVLGRAVAYGAREGLVKVVIDQASNCVLGVQALGDHMTEMITEATMAVQHRLTAEQFVRTIHPHPTLAEAFHEAVELALGHPVHI